MQRSIIAPAERVTNLRWGIAFLLGVGILVNYFDRVNLTVSGGALRQEFGIDDVGFGYLLSAFGWTYAVAQIPVGVLLDRYGVTIVGRISTFCWSIFSLLTAAVGSFGMLFGMRLGLGLAETPAFPINAKATGYWFPTGERGVATAIFDSAAKLRHGDRRAVRRRWSSSTTAGAPRFSSPASISFLFFVAFYALYRNPGEDTRLTHAEREYIKAGGAQAEGVPTSGSVGGTFLYLLRQTKVWGLTIGFAAYGYSFYLLLTWLPGYLVHTFNMTRAFERLLHRYPVARGGDRRPRRRRLLGRHTDQARAGRNARAQDDPRLRHAAGLEHLRGDHDARPQRRDRVHHNRARRPRGVGADRLVHSGLDRTAGSRRIGRLDHELREQHHVDRRPDRRRLRRRGDGQLHQRLPHRRSGAGGRAF